MTASDLAQKIKTILDDKKAKDIDVIDVSDKTILADYFVIATGTSTTHVKALADEVEYLLKEKDQRLVDHVEGFESSRWILLDYGDVVVHVFHSEERDFYSLEKLWQQSRSRT
ncbi:MAG: ribosome silencing factor [Clostridia bacterium]|nr:ribosome silencing factor [Clostridia bacterium]NCC74863.1 ribosome silencing factor [Clostridia bacterium]